MVGRRGRRIASLWLPRAAAERAARRIYGRDGVEAPLALAAEVAQAQRLISATAAAEALGADAGRSLADARAVAPHLAVRPFDAAGHAAFQSALLRWAGRYAPWVGPDRAAPEPDRRAEQPDGGAALALDVTGCAHLFGGEQAMLSDMLARLARMGLSARAAIADGKGAAWALARFGERPIEIAAPGGSAAAIGALPPAALRLDAATASALRRLGVDRIDALAALPRASVARRFGAPTTARLDQALGRAPEPVSPVAPPPHDAVRLSLPEPIGTLDDVRAGAARLLERLCAKLEAREAGARRLRLTLRRVDRGEAFLEIGLARPGRDPDRILPLFERGLSEIDAGFGIDALRLEALVVEPAPARQVRIVHDPAQSADSRARDAFDDVLSRLGARIGFDRIIRLAPGESHTPERAFVAASAAYSEPARDWAAAAARRPPRPLEVFAPEPMVIDAEATPGGARSAARPPDRFVWRGVERRAVDVVGPERIAPEWWLDDPAWRDGVRDYWRVDCEDGAALWAHHTPQKSSAPRWFVVGRFA